MKVHMTLHDFTLLKYDIKIDLIIVAPVPICLTPGYVQGYNTIYAVLVEYLSANLNS